ALGRCRGAPPFEAALLTPERLAARCLDGLGAIDLALGKPEAALRHHRRALDLAGATGDWSAEIRARVYIGYVHLEQDDLAMAFIEARAALTKSNAALDRAGQARSLRLLAAISAAQGAYGEAERAAQLAATYSAGARARALEVQIWEDLAGYAADQGLDQAAEEARQEAERLRRHWWGEPPAPTEATVG
ncbi:MAG: hypothetical protein HGA45_13455, partial [Chloroflexales bacterium]|nr:hypothetical protein [Chloroflexales bacterium]